MIVRRARVQNYKSIDDSGWVDLDRVTCLVGKNESGKTAFLQALTKFNPAAGQSGEFDATLEYPRKRLNSYERGLADGGAAARVVSVEFELEQQDLDELPGSLDGALKAGDLLVINKSYENKKLWDFSLDETQVVKNLLAKGELPEPHSKSLEESKSVSDLRAGLGQIADEVPQAAELVRQIDEWQADPSQHFIDKMTRFVPKFFYFDDYSIMRGRVSVADLIRKRDADELEEQDRTFLAFLRFVGADLEQFQSEENFESLTAKLEAASNEISDELFKFWTQNQQLAVQFRLSGPDAAAPPPLNQGNNLHIRINNERHRVSVPFDQRSRGFVWFFSFLVYFSQLQESDNLVLLLDEPGLSLHAKAQADFLRFIDDRLAPEYPVIYTTHSPFMVDPAQLHRARTVEDHIEAGTQISSDVFASDSDTVFPLQAALGFELAQTLFVGKDNLIVEGPSDYIYLTVLSAYLREKGRTELDQRWTIVPVGGIDKIPTFVALLGTQLDVAVMVDGRAGGSQKINDLIDHGLIKESRVVALANILEVKVADIEDFFEEGFYCKLVKDSGAANAAKSNLKAGDRLVQRIEEAAGKFDHYQPARYLLEHQTDLLPKIDDVTLDRFTKLFAELNALLD